MVELKDHQPQEIEGKLQFHSHLTDGKHVLIFESLQLAGLYVGDLLYEHLLEDADQGELEACAHKAQTPRRLSGEGF